MASYGSSGCTYGESVQVVGYASDGYSQSTFSPKKTGIGCTCYGQGCKSTCRM